MTPELHEKRLKKVDVESHEWAYYITANCDGALIAIFGSQTGVDKWLAKNGYIPGGPEDLGSYILSENR